MQAEPEEPEVAQPGQPTYVPEYLMTRLRNLAAGPIQFAQRPDGSEYRVIAHLADGTPMTGVGVDCETAARQLSLKMQNPGTVRVHQERHAKALDEEIDRRYAILGIPSEPIPPRCTPENPCETFDERHAALFDICYHKGPSPT